MDPALIRERERFKKRAYNANTSGGNESKSQSSKPSKEKASTSNGSVKKKSNIKRESNGATTSSTLSRDPLSYSKLSGSSTHNFAILAKIVNYMKTRYLDGDSEALSLEDILDETNQLDIGAKQKHWLATESLCNNPKVTLTQDGKYAYKPKFQLKTKQTLLRLLDRYDQRGLGGIAMEDVLESLPNAEKIVKELVDKNRIIVITRPADKKKVLYYYDQPMDFKVDEEFQKLWRSVAVEGIDEEKIEEYLNKQGLNAQDSAKKVVTVHKRKKAASKKNRIFKKHNDHLGDLLQDFTHK